MENLQQKQADVGVIVGRFQVPKLHEGHQELINSVKSRHARVIIVLGLAHGKCTFENPLDFACRQAMFHEQYPEFTVLYIKDTQTNEEWSAKLDEMIHDLVGPDFSVCMYGSRDSFLKAYTGRYPAAELEQKTFVSGTETRKRIAQKIERNESFRAGAVWAVGNQWPGPKMTIDVAIFNDSCTQILLGRKKNEEGYRVIGGFVQNNETLAQTVAREGKEETHLELGDYQYVNSYVSSDWRYRGERDKILTVLYTAKIVGGKPEPDDDIHELKWFDFNKDLVKYIISNHKQMIEDLLDRMSVSAG